MADIKKYRVCTQSAPAGYMITDAAMRLPQPKEKTPTTVGVFNGNPFAANVGRPFMADIKKYPGMHPICACGLHDYGCRNAVATGKRKRRQPSAFLMTIPL